MLSHGRHDSSVALSQQQKWHAHAVTISLEIGASRPPIVTAHKTATPITISHQHQNVKPADMAGETELLECPMCAFTVLPTDDYILQLHFEQVHTTDSPFKIDGDVEPPLPTAPKRKHAHADTPDTTSSDDDEGDMVTCPEPECGEVVSLADFNDHLDFHAAESLSYDETTGKYHPHYSSATMQSLAAHQPHEPFTKNTFSEYHFTTDLPDALKKADGHGKKHGHRKRSNTSSSGKSTLSRSILTFNPFTKAEKSIKPPNKSARLGVSYPAPGSLQMLTRTEI
jgi:hypothetical protein